MRVGRLTDDGVIADHADAEQIHIRHSARLLGDGDLNLTEVRVQDPHAGRERIALTGLRPPLGTVPVVATPLTLYEYEKLNAVFPN